MMQALLVALVKGYRLVLSPWLGQSCRFSPTCSLYAIEALQTHGAAAGSYLALKRIARCQPWCDGGIDPVPGCGPHRASDAALFSFIPSDDKKSSS